MRRRDFIRAGGLGMAAALLGTGTGLLGWTPRSQAATVRKTFFITEGMITQPDGVDVYFRGYSSTPDSLAVPGEAWIVQEGDTVEIEVVNTLSTEHSWVIDGVADSGVIPSGESRTVRFVADRPGSHTIEITHQQIAQELGTSREVVSRMLKRLEKEQCVRLSRGKITVADPERFPLAD